MNTVDRRPRWSLIVTITILGVSASIGSALAQSKMRETVKPVKVVQIYGRDTLEVGELETYRMRVNSPYAASYMWRVSDGTELPGNPVVYRFDAPGRYTLIGTATNPSGKSSDTLEVLIVGKARPKPAVASKTTAPVEKKAAPSAAKKPPKSTETSPSAVALTKPAADAPNAVGSEAPSLKGGQGDFTWIVATYFQQPDAEAFANSFRAIGYRAGVYVDTGGKGSTVFRVTLGRFDSEQKALQAKQEVQDNGVKNPILHRVKGA